jgi:hypothetical protein
VGGGGQGDGLYKTTSANASRGASLKRLTGGGR